MLTELNMNIVIISHHSLMNGLWCRFLLRFSSYGPNDFEMILEAFCQKVTEQKVHFIFDVAQEHYYYPHLMFSIENFCVCIDFIIHTVFVERRKWNKSSERSFCLISGTIVLDFNFDLFDQKIQIHLQIHKLHHANTKRTCKIFLLFQTYPNIEFQGKK